MQADPPHLAFGHRLGGKQERAEKDSERDKGKKWRRLRSRLFFVKGGDFLSGLTQKILPVPCGIFSLYGESFLEGVKGKISPCGFGQRPRF